MSLSSSNKQLIADGSVLRSSGIRVIRLCNVGPGSFVWCWVPAS